MLLNAANQHQCHCGSADRDHETREYHRQWYRVRYITRSFCEGNVNQKYTGTHHVQCQNPT